MYILRKWTAKGVVPIKEHERDIQPAGIQTSSIAEHTHNTRHHPFLCMKEVISVRHHRHNIHRNSKGLPDGYMPIVKIDNKTSAVPHQPITAEYGT